MINFPRQAYANPFLTALNSPFGGVNPLTLGQQMGGLVPTPFGYLPMTQLAQYDPLAQVGAGIVPGISPLGIGQAVNPLTSQFGQYNPLLSQIGAGFNPVTSQFGQVGQNASQSGGYTPAINPFFAQSTTNWPGAQYTQPNYSQQAVGGRIGAYGVDPRVTGAGVGQQFGYTDPNVILGLLNTALAGDPFGQQQVNPFGQQQVNPFGQQQLPIRPLINSPQMGGFQSSVPGIAQGTQWPAAQVDPYRAFIEAQLISQLATNPLYQLQHQLQPHFQQGFQPGFGGGPETIGLGTPFGTGQQFNPLYGNVPFCG
jgi:hypothetical protein